MLESQTRMKLISKNTTINTFTTCKNPPTIQAQNPKSEVTHITIHIQQPKFSIFSAITCACAGGVAALNKKAFNNAVEYGVVVVAFEAELNEVPDGLWGLFGPELHVERPMGCLQHHLALRRWL